MNHRRCPIAIGFVIGTVVFAAGGFAVWPAAAAADAPPPPATQPAGVTLSAEADVAAVLQRLDADGTQLQDFSADVTLSDIDNVSGDQTSEAGTVLFKNAANGNDAKILVNFTKEISNDISMPRDHQYLLADGWLTDRDDKKKTEVKRQVLKPGQKINLLKLGEGPFPLPIGQSPADVEANFTVSRQPLSKDDPAGTIHLQLVPKAGTDFAKKFAQLDVFVDPKSGWPVRISADDSDHGHTHVTDLSNLKVNVGIKDSQLSLPPVKGNWSVSEEPMGN